MALLCWAGIASSQGAEESPLHFDHWNIAPPAPADDPSGDAAPASDPSTFPLEDEFAQRRERVIRMFADEDFARWRRGFFTGGDPGKYLPGAAMAKLLINPDDTMVREYMNDGRSAREHYHFAAVNWARFIPLFADVLTEDTMQLFNERGGRYTDYLTGGGTENHKTMQYTGPLVLPWYTDHGLGNLDRDATLEAGKEWIRDYVRNIYAVGMGEWESSTYHAFTINGFLNVYDFAQDEEVRLIAKAALDYFVGAYALKYTDGVLSGPSQRGFSRHSGASITDALGWLWWGSSDDLVPERNHHHFRYSSHTWTSRWRPNRVLTNIATRNLPQLPAEWRNSKSNYWFGQRIEPRGNHYHESFFVSPSFSLGSLWWGWDRHGQTVRWQLSTRGRDGAVTMTGGHPVMGRIWDGLGRYEQTAQADSTLVLLADIPEDDEYPFTMIHIPENATWPERHEDWWIMRTDDTWIAVHPLTRDTEAVTPAFAPRSSRDQRRGNHPETILHIPGRRSGFILQVAERSTIASVEDLLGALDESAVRIDDDEDTWQVHLTTLHGRDLKVSHQPGERHAQTHIDDQLLTFVDWPVFSGPYFSLDDGVLRAWDGSDGYQVDFTGDLPVYSEWSPDK
ncbi:MAG: hypothetical protein EA401_01050 [Planctomycetota bacterium]|nr:MAG: hypothetical protein EA401_01050 [Planctomycetota bacterium]